MYDELVKRLREAPGDWPDADLHYEAADAIEELQKAVYFHKYNSEFWEDKYNSLVDEKWIPVTERLPDIGSNCLISPVSGCVAEGQFDGDGWTQYRWSAKFDKDTITHWMPLPSTEGLDET